MRVVVINTEEAKDRLVNITKEMTKTGLDYSVITALPKVELSKTNSGWTSGADSLRRTTIEIVKKALEDNVTLWIWEDDCVINKSYFDRMMKSLPLLNDNYDFIHLNYSGSKMYSHKTKGPFRLMIDGSYNCQSYIINPSVMREYLELLEDKVPIDQNTKDLHSKYKNSYIVEPAPVSHTVGNYSYIREKKVDY